MKRSSIEVREDFPELLNDLGLSGIGVEIGVQKGVFAKTLLDGWKTPKLYLIDAWRQFGPEAADNPGPDGQLSHFAETFKATYFHYDRAVIIKELSVPAAKLFPDDFFDFVYIDAAHDKDNVEADLKAWYPKVRRGGVFAGHDYFDGYVHMTTAAGEYDIENVVKSVVDNFLIKQGLQAQSTTKDSFPSWWTIK